MPTEVAGPCIAAALYTVADRPFRRRHRRLVIESRAARSIDRLLVVTPAKSQPEMTGSISHNRTYTTDLSPVAATRFGDE
jgi:hypothetical protein